MTINHIFAQDKGGDHTCFAKTLWEYVHNRACSKRKKIIVDFRGHLNFMEGTCIEHKDHFAVIFETLYPGNNTCKQYRDFTKEMT